MENRCSNLQEQLRESVRESNRAIKGIWQLGTQSKWLTHFHIAEKQKNTGMDPDIRHRLFVYITFEFFSWPALIREQEQEKRRVHDLQTQLHEKSKQFQKLQVFCSSLFVRM